ncbi:MFHAS1 [Branchiostoma lanceolatum]|uniref:Leucine-rich repeat and death domain-containing protein 1 n=1 Tax=Branchiostoma lanceolatum TaxID=7740 RepID=A0A8J9VKC9_BRALA|nr:MFHAS1 [Branchiostoma lanceolatum]
MKLVKWYMMGKETTLLTLDFTGRHLTPLPNELFDLNELEALRLDRNKDIQLSEKLIKLTNLKVLSLFECNLDTVPAVVMKLPQLKTLMLGNNRNIILPDEMSSLVNLSYLDLRSCELTSVPAVVMKLSQLKGLRLSCNKNIKLPDEMSSLVDITYLDLGSCDLDTLQPVVLKLLNLQTLDLSYNPLISIPEELDRLENIKGLQLRYCDLTTVPPAVLKLPQLEELDLGGNRRIHLPDELAGLTNIRVLKLNSTGMRTVPPVVWRLTQLEWLGLSYNLLQTLPAEVGQLTNVKHLDLFQCQLHTLPPEVGRLTQLERLGLRGNPLQTLPAEIGQLSNVKHLNLSHCQLHTLPPEVGRLTQLEWLNLCLNPLQKLPAEVGQLTNVKHLDLPCCQLSTLPLEVSGLTQLEWLDLSSNPLQTLPAEVGQLTNIKHLDLSYCQLHTLPPEVGRLTQLERLDLRSNPLQTLPAEIGQLTNVKHLDLSYFQLHTLPREVGRLTQLEWLNLSSNPLQMLPAEIGQLTNVKHLYLSNCELRTLPPEVEGMSQLERLNLRDNQLQTLPTEVGQLVSVNDLDVNGNPLIKPPAEVCRQGIHAIRQYFKELERSEEKVSARLKVVVLGEKMAGKTSLIQSLERGESSLTEEEDRTHCVEITQWAPDDDITFEVYDFGGHDVYHLTHQFFLTPDAFYLLLVNLQTYSCSEQSYTEAVGFWLDTLNARVPGAVVSLVGSKKDLCRSEDVKRKTSDIQERVKQQTLLVLPKTWVEFRQLVQNQGMIEVPEQADEIDYAEEMSPLGLIEQAINKQHWLAMADCARLGQLAGLSSDRLEPVLSYLQQVGTILRYTDIPELKDFVFHDPPALIEIFKDLFHHDTNELFSTPRFAHFTSAQLRAFQSDLCDRGLIQKEVMTCLLPTNINPDIIIALMQHFGLCFELQADGKPDPSKHTLEYKIPWYLQNEMPDELISVWPEDVPETQEQLQLMCDIRGFCPRGLFQRFSVGIHPLVKDRVDWKDGVMAYRHDYQVLVCSKPVADDTYITMATRGRLAQADEMWGVVHPLLEVLVQLLQEWPGVLYSLHVTCAHCIKAGLDNPHQYDLRDRTADDDRDVRCPRVKKTASTSADLVYRPNILSGPVVMTLKLCLLCLFNKDCYKMTSDPRGLALIISNTSFTDQTRNRLGGEKDLDRLRTICEKLKLQQEIREDLTAQQIEAAANDVSRRDHSDFDCFVLFLLSHGTEDGVQGTDGQHVSVDSIISSFQACQSLVGKPKLFFIQACRGADIDKGQERKDSFTEEGSSTSQAGTEASDGTTEATESPSPPTTAPATSAAPLESHDAGERTLPTASDRLVMHATVHGHVSWRNSNTGTWLIQVLADVITEHAETETLLEMLTRVNARVADFKTENQEYKQQPEVTHTLRKKLYFFPEAAVDQNP